MKRIGIGADCKGMKNEQPRSLSAEDLTAYVDGELGWWRRTRLRRHLRRCEPCRRYVEQVSGIVGSLRASEPTDTLGGDIRADLRREYADWAARRRSDTS